MKLHHATVAKAEKAKILITTMDQVKEGGPSDVFVFKDAVDPVIWSTNSDPKAGLDEAITRKDSGVPAQSIRDLLSKNRIMDDGYRQTYRANNDSCGDDIASTLTEATVNGEGKVSIPNLYAIAADNDIDPAKYEHLNNGMQRMNIGNRLRGRLRKGLDVTIDGTTFKAENYVD